MRALRRVGLAPVVVLAISAWATGAAAVTFFDSFDAEAAGLTKLNYGAFANFDVSDGKVDLIGPGNLHGLVGTGSYVDLDGTNADGGVLTTKQSFAFAAGDVVTLSFELAGNQRRKSAEGDDTIFGGFKFDTTTSVRNYSLSGGYGGVALGNFTATDTSDDSLVGWTAPYEIYTIRFVAGSAGNLKAFVGSKSTDNIGPLLDNFRLTIASAVPEPATWATMITGFGAVGVLLRRSRERSAFRDA